MALEQRFMFDGAALDQVVDAGALAASDIDTPALYLIDTSEMPIESATLNLATKQAQGLIFDYISRVSAEEAFAIFNGGLQTMTAEWESRWVESKNTIINNEYSIKLSLVSASDINGAIGAFYRASSSSGLIFINKDHLIDSTPESLAKVIVEEIGHGIDFLVNDSKDTPGDEGKVLANHIFPSENLTLNQSENDHGAVWLDGQELPVEFSVIDVAYRSLSFDASSLKAGTSGSVGATYLYTGVDKPFNTANPLVDAVMTITQKDSGVRIDSIDSTSTSGASSGNTPAFIHTQLTGINGSNSNGQGVTVKIEFIEAGSFNSANNSGTPITLENIRVNTYDIDIKQYQQFSSFSTGKYNTGGSINASYDATSGLIEFKSTVTTNASGTTTNQNTAIQVDYASASQIEFKIGSYGFENVNGGAYFFVDFGSNSLTFDSSITPAQVGAPAPGDTIAPEIALAASETTLVFGQTANLTFNLTEDSSDFLQSSVTVTGGTLSNWQVVNASQYTATFSPTAASGSVSVASGTFSDAAANTNADGADANNTIAFTYDSTAPTFSIGDVTVSEGGLATFTVTRTGASAVSQSVDVSSLAVASPDTADAADFTALASTTLTFAAGVNTQTVSVQTTQDTTFEGAETFRVQLANATSGALISGAAGTATATIVDDARSIGGTAGNDDRPSFSVADVSVSEGGLMTFTVTRTGASAVSQTIDFASSVATGDTAVASDFTGAIGTLTFAAGVTTQTFTVQTLADDVYEGAETFTVTLTNNSAGSTIADGTAVASILDDGTGPLGPDQVTPDDDRRIEVAGLDKVSEGSRAIFTVALPDGNARDTIIALSLVDGTATAADFNPSVTAYYFLSGSKVDLPVSNGTVTLPSGSPRFYVSVATTQDLLLETSESFALTASIQGGASASANAEIVDDGTGFTYDDQGLNPSGPGDDDTPKAVAPVTPPPVIDTPPALVIEAVPAPIASPLAAPSFTVPDVPYEPTLTQGEGFKITVIRAVIPTLIVNNEVPEQFLENLGGVQQFVLPTDTFAHTNPDVSITLSAKLQDGGDLPNWVRFDPESGQFFIEAPQGYQGTLKLNVMARDNEGREAQAPLTFHIGEKISGRLSLQDKLSLHKGGLRETGLLKALLAETTMNTEATAGGAFAQLLPAMATDVPDTAVTDGVRSGDDVEVAQAFSGNE